MIRHVVDRWTDHTALRAHFARDATDNARDVG
jgi:quinol monooxygenase YgiN